MEKPLAGSNPMLHFQIRAPSTGVRPPTTLFHGLFGESLRPCGPWLFLPLSGQCLDRAGRRGSSTLPSADFCAPFRSSHDSLSPVHGTGRRSPGVSLTAFTAALPDLQPWPLMDVDFAISRPLVRPRMPRIRFVFL